MKRFSKARGAVEIQMHKVYDILDEEIGRCECCGAIRYDHSHNFPRSQFPSVIHERDNITLLCREHHIDWEESNFDKLGSDIVLTVIGRMVRLARTDRYGTMLPYISSKIINAYDKNPHLEWLKELYDAL